MSPEVQVPGATLHVRVAGPEDAPPLVLLHAFPLDGRMWDAHVEEWAKSWRVIVPDVRGHGRSEAGDGQYAIDFFADDLFAVLDATARGPVVACGISMGGYVLLRAAEREPDRFRGLVLVDTRSAGDLDAGRVKRFDAVRVIRDEGPAAYADMFVKTALGRSTREERPEVVEAVRSAVAAGNARGMIGAQLAMAARTDTTDALEGIRVPALVIVGDEDTLTPTSSALEMATRISGARLVVIPGAGHLTPLEAPEEFGAAVQGFLDAFPRGEG